MPRRALGLALLLAALLTAPAAATPTPPLAPTAAPPAAPPPEVGAEPLLAAALSPVVVPPEAPVAVTVDAPLLARRPVELQEHTAEAWLPLARTTLAADGTATFRLTRRAAGVYRFRVAEAVTAARALASTPLDLTVTTTGSGDPTAYRYLYRSRGVPARWNPCAPITYRVNAAAAGPGAVADLREALRRVSYETGLRFVYRGTTAQVPGARTFRYDADVVVAWSRAGGSAYLGGSVAGAGGFASPVRGRGGRPRIVRGFMVFDADRMAALTPGFGAGRTTGQALLHEVGHLVGLAHVRADDQIMRPSVDDVPATLYGAGDLTGLRRIGRRAGCV